MTDFEDELREALGRVEPPPSFLESVVSRLPQPASYGAQLAGPRADSRPIPSGASISSLIIRAAKAARYYTNPSAGAWEVSSLAGAPRIGTEKIIRSGRLAVGDWLETDGSSRAKIDIGKIGYVEVEPQSRVRLIAARLRDHRLALFRGCLRATIWAPPRLFFVETPSATAIDLGCAYTLTVTDSGSSFLHVTSGWVALARAGRDSIVPAGAVCETRLGVGPGTPYFADATPALRGALSIFDFACGRPAARVAALEVVLSEARERDALTLFHLLSRVEDGERGRVYDRLTDVVAPPAGTSREAILRLDKRALSLWQGKLELDWFRSDPAWRKAWRRAWKRL